jgi:hypothetical protein
MLCPARVERSFCEAPGVPEWEMLVIERDLDLKLYRSLRSHAGVTAAADGTLEAFESAHPDFAAWCASAA